MKKKLKSLLLVAIAAVAGYNVYASHVECEYSDVILANVEALAEVEDSISDKIWHRHDYKLENGTPGVNCWKGGSDDCLL